MIHDHQFSVATRATATGPVLIVRGELDLATAPELLEKIKDLIMTRGQLLVVDLAELRFCDSSGITALIAARNVTATADAHIALVSVPVQLNRVLNLIGLARSFPTYPSTEQAIAAHHEHFGPAGTI